MPRESERRSPRPGRGDVTGRARWLAARGRNAARHRVRFAVLGTVLFVGMLVFLVLLPGSSRTMRAGLVLREGVQDTAPLLVALQSAQREYEVADSVLREVRARIAAPPVVPAATLSPSQRWKRDSLAQVVAVLSRMISRVENSPLPQTYRALGESAPLRNNPRVRELLDTLVTIENERDAFGAVSGVDPMFVALTARANGVGRTIQGIAEAERTLVRDEMQRIAQAARDTAQLIQAAAADSSVLRPSSPLASALTTPDTSGMTGFAAGAPATPGAMPILDTLPFRARADTAGVMRERAASSLAIARTFNADLERRAEEARNEANTLAPPLAILAASLLLGITFAFAVSLFLEVSRPTIADAAEAERITGVRVLGIVRAGDRPGERDRRLADLTAPPDLQPWSRAYRAISLHLSARGEAARNVIVVGDDSAVAAAVAANLVFIAATDARSALLVDADTAECGISSLLHLDPSPGTADVLTQHAGWADVIVTPDIGRDRMLDVVPAGSRELEMVDPGRAAEAREELARVARRYDICVAASPPSLLQDPTFAVLPVEDVLLCVRISGTTIRALSELAAHARRSHVSLRGIVLWHGESPSVRSRSEQALFAAAQSTPDTSAETPAVATR